MLLGTLGPSLLGNLLTRKRIVRAGSGNKKGKWNVRAGAGRLLSYALPKNGIFNTISSFNKFWNTKIL